MADRMTLMDAIAEYLSAGSQRLLIWVLREDLLRLEAHMPDYDAIAREILREAKGHALAFRQTHDLPKDFRKGDIICMKGRANLRYCFTKAGSIGQVLRKTEDDKYEVRFTKLTGDPASGPTLYEVNAEDMVLHEEDMPDVALRRKDTLSSGDRVLMHGATDTIDDRLKIPCCNEDKTGLLWSMGTIHHIKDNEVYVTKSYQSRLADRWDIVCRPDMLELAEPYEDSYAEFLRDAQGLMHTARMSKGCRVKINEKSEYADQNKGIGTLRGNFDDQDPEDYVGVVFDDGYTNSYRRKDLRPYIEPALMEEKQHLLEGMVREAEEKHGLDAYRQSRDAMIRISVKRLRGCHVSDIGIMDFLWQALRKVDDIARYIDRRRP